MVALLMATVLAVGLLAGYFGWSYRLHVTRASWASLAAGVVMGVDQTVELGAYSITVDSIMMLRDRTDVHARIRQPETDRVMGGTGHGTVIPGVGAEARPVRLEFECPPAAVRATLELPPGP